MKFGPVPLSEASGKVLAHNISDDTGRRVLRKGLAVDAAVIALLTGLGYDRVYVAELEEGDVGEDEAAERVARVVAGPGVEASSAHTGRVNLTATVLGVVRVDVGRLERLNEITGVTVATLAAHGVARPGQRVATVKVIPYALPRSAVERAECGPEGAARSYGETPRGSGIVSVSAIGATGVAVVLVGSRGVWPALEEGLGGAISRRLAGLNCPTQTSECVPLDETALAGALRRAAEGSGTGMIVVGGETAIMDVNDLIPRGIALAGGRIEHLGLAMDPGHLLLLGYLGDVPVVGAPGCVRGSAPDGFDAVVPRLLAGETLTHADLERLGHGGLLSDPRARPDPRPRSDPRPR
jgi:molybdenum cofactor cytidylyltransferase